MATELTKVRENLSQSLGQLPNLRGSTARWTNLRPALSQFQRIILWVKLRKILGVSKETSV